MTEENNPKIVIISESQLKMYLDIIVEEHLLLCETTSMAIKTNYLTFTNAINYPFTHTKVAPYKIDETKWKRVIEGRGQQLYEVWYDKITNYKKAMRVKTSDSTYVKIYLDNGNVKQYRYSDHWTYIIIKNFTFSMSEPLNRLRNKTFHLCFGTEHTIFSKNYCLILSPYMVTLDEADVKNNIRYKSNGEPNIQQYDGNSFLILKPEFMGLKGGEKMWGTLNVDMRHNNQYLVIPEIN